LNLHSFLCRESASFLNITESGMPPVPVPIFVAKDFLQDTRWASAVGLGSPLLRRFFFSTSLDMDGVFFSAPVLFPVKSLPTTSVSHWWATFLPPPISRTPLQTAIFRHLSLTGELSGVYVMLSSFFLVIWLFPF